MDNLISGLWFCPIVNPDPDFFVEVVSNGVAHGFNQRQGTSNRYIPGHHVAHGEGHTHVNRSRMLLPV